MHLNGGMNRLRLIGLLWVVSCLSMSAADWPQWRGPERNGHAPGASLEKLPSSPRVVWKIAAGPGLASPVVAGDKAFLFDAVDKKETLHAVDRKTGKKIWSAAIDETFHDSQGPDGPRSTPLVDGNRVYVVSCRGELQCLDVKDGSVVWRTNFADFGVKFIGEKGTAPGAIRHGNNGTPLIDEHRLYVCVGGEGAGVVCFDKLTGKVIWKSQDDQAAYAPPMIGTIAGQEQVICFTAEGLIGLAPEKGSLFWRVPIKTAYARHVIAPVWHENIVVVSSHQAGLIGTKISRKGDELKAEEAWVSKEAVINFSSPVAVDGYLYGLGPAKNLQCVVIATGKVAWSQDGYVHTSADKAYGGFIVVGDNILFLNDSGQLVLFAVNPEKFEERGTAQVAGNNWCNPAYAGGQLFLRDGNKGPGEWMCIDLAGSN